MFKFIAAFALVAIAAAAPGFVAETHHSLVQPAVFTKSAVVDTSASSAITHQSFTNLEKKVPIITNYAAAAPIVKTFGSPLVHTYETSPVVRTVASTPAVKTIEAAPVIHTYNAAPVVHAYEAAPVVHTYQAAPVVKTVSSPIVKTIAAAPVVHNTYAAAPLVHPLPVLHSAPVVYHSYQ